MFEAAQAQAGRGGGAAGTTGRGRSGGGAGAGAGLAGLGAGAGAGRGAAGGIANLDFLRNNPQFQQLRQIVQTTPQMLEPILQQVGAGNPQLAQLIQEHPEQFLQLLSEEADNDAPAPPGAQEVFVTEEEREAIDRVSVFWSNRALWWLIISALPSWFRARYGHPGVLRLRQERRARCELPL